MFSVCGDFLPDNPYGPMLQDCNAYTRNVSNPLQNIDILECPMMFVSMKPTVSPAGGPTERPTA